MRKLTGVDADIETSLKEYGIAWQEKGDDIVFYYGIKSDDAGDYTGFDWGSFALGTDIKKEFDWADFDKVSDYIDTDIFELPLHEQINSLRNYYGYENVFGSTYYAGMPYCEVVTGRKLTFLGLQPHINNPLKFSEK